MSLKYNCPHCGSEIITKFLNPGDTLFCPECKVLFAVPSDAMDSDSEPSFRKTIQKSNTGDTVNEILASPVSIEESLPPEPTPWGVGSIFKFLGAYLLAILLLSCIVGFIVVLIGGSHSAGHKVEIGPNEGIFSVNQGRVVSVFEMVFSMLIPVLFIYYSVVKRHHQDFFKALHLRKLARSELWRYIKIGGGLAVTILGLLLFIGLTSLRKLIPENLPIDKYLKTGYFEAIIFTINGILAPFSEELMFRGYFFQGLHQKLSVLTSAIIVSVAFTLMHGFQLAFSPIPLLLIGAISALLIYTRIKTDSLTNCIVIHFIYNAILLILIWFGVITFGFETTMKM